MIIEECSKDSNSNLGKETAKEKINKMILKHKGRIIRIMEMVKLIERVVDATEEGLRIILLLICLVGIAEIVIVIIIDLKNKITIEMIIAIIVIMIRTLMVRMHNEEVDNNNNNLPEGMEDKEERGTGGKMMIIMSNLKRMTEVDRIIEKSHRVVINKRDILQGLTEVMKEEIILL